MGQRYGCTDEVFLFYIFATPTGTYTTIAKRISRILGPFRSAPFSAPLRRHYKRICGGEGESNPC